MKHPSINRYHIQIPFDQVIYLGFRRPGGCGWKHVIIVDKLQNLRSIVVSTVLFLSFSGPYVKIGKQSVCFLMAPIHPFLPAS